MPAEDSSASVLPEPWRSFLRELDGLLKGPVELRCLGGFVITQQYGIGRETSDIDYLALAAQSRDDDVEALAGLGSKLHRKYRVYTQYVGIVTPQLDRNDYLATSGSTAYNGLAAEAPMTNVTVQLSDREIEALKARTGKRSAAAALKAWAARANAKRSAAELRAALKESLKEEAAGKGRRFDSGREAIRWLES